MPQNNTPHREDDAKINVVGMRLQSTQAEHLAITIKYSRWADAMALQDGHIYQLLERLVVIMSRNNSIKFSNELSQKCLIYMENE